MRLSSGRTTLSKFIIDHLQGLPDHAALGGLLIDVAAAVKAIAAITGKGALDDHYGQAGTSNVHGEAQTRLDLMADEIVIDHVAWSGLVAGLVSEEQESPIVTPPTHGRGPYLLAFDPLDGASNVGLNLSVGTIFSVLAHPHPGEPAPADFLQPGRRQIAAGYAIYGPATMLVLTVGSGTWGFTLDREIGNFVLTHPKMLIPPDTAEFAINTSHERFWEPPVQRYVAECNAGSAGIRSRDFNMHWIASMVADVHRVLMRGGVFLYPRDVQPSAQPERLRLLYEANPIAYLVEQAGGAASTGRGPVLDVVPEAPHQHIALMLGARNEIERIERYHREFDDGTDKPYVNPLFNERSLLRAQA